MSAIQKVRSTAEYEALQVLGENLTQIRSWVLAVPESQESLREVQDFSDLQEFWIVRHPSGFLSFVHPADFPTEFDSAEESLFESLEAEMGGESLEADKGTLSTVEEWEVKTPDSGLWVSDYVKAEDATDAVNLVNELRTHARTRLKVTVTKPWRIIKP